MQKTSNILAVQTSSIKKSHINLTKDIAGNTHMNEHLSEILTQQMLLKCIKNSYIGQISGNKHQIKELNYDDYLPNPLQDLDNPENQTHSQIKRSSLKRVATSKILKTDRSMDRIDETSQKLIQLQNKQVFSLKSFTGQDKVQLLTSSNCGFCSKNTYSNQVKLLLCNDSVLEIYKLSPEVFIPNPNGAQLIFTLNFDTVAAEVNISQYQNNKQLSIIVGGYTILLQHQNRQVVVDWYQKLQAMRQGSKGKEFNLTQLIQLEEFYLRRFESEDYFVNNCQTGDIILFQDNHFYAKVQRFLTRSNFDHVAMVIRDVNYGLLLFQSNSGSGVSLTPWKSLIRYRWYQEIPRITWRKLQVQRDIGFNLCIQNFVKENIQKKYHISFQKLTTPVSIIHRTSKDTESAEINQEHGYFCSQLVATLYKQLGLLTRDTNNLNYQPACKFYPKDFSEKGNRTLDKGTLSPEYDIFFDHKVLKQKYKQIFKDEN